MDERCDRCPAYGCAECPWQLLNQAHDLLAQQEKIIKGQEALLFPKLNQPPDPGIPQRRSKKRRHEDDDWSQYEEWEYDPRPYG